VPPFSVPFTQSSSVPFPPLLFRLGKNIMSSVGNRLFQQSDLVCSFSSFYYSFYTRNSIVTIYIWRSRGIKRKNISYVVVATYSIIFVYTFSAIVYNYTSSRCRNVMDVIPRHSTEDCDLSPEISTTTIHTLHLTYNISFILVMTSVYSSIH
jgi:hypothetical protein